MSIEIKGRVNGTGPWRNVKVNDEGELLVSTTGSGPASDATAANQQAQIDELQIIKDSQTVNVDWDYYDITYVTAGNGIGEIETITYFTGTPGSGTQVLQITLTYDASSNITRLVRT